MPLESIRERYEHARRQYEAGRFDVALRLFESIEKSYPNHSDAMYARALCLESLERFKEARQLCNKLVNLCGDQRAIALRKRIETRLRANRRETSSET